MDCIALSVFTLFCVGIFVCYLFAYMLHGRPVKCPSSARIDGKTVVITGGSSGIGFETALELAHRGARIIIVSRCRDRGQQAVKRIIEETGNKQVSFAPVDLSNWQSIRELTNHITATETHLDILINNAGIAGCENSHRNAHRYDRAFAVNYLGHFLLTYGLLPLLIRSAPSRIISVASIAHSFMREPLFELSSKCHNGNFCRNLVGYDASKLALVLHTKELARQLGGTGVTANCLHPGIVDTNLWHQIQPNVTAYFQHLMRFLIRPLFMSANAGSQTSVYCAVANELSGVSGKYYWRCQLARESVRACNPQIASQLWHVSMLLTGCLSTGDITRSTNDKDTKHYFTTEEDDNEKVVVGTNLSVVTEPDSHCALAIERG